MVGQLKNAIEGWCAANCVAIPPGFYRHPAQRYAAVDVSHEPPKLVARTWSKLEDMQYYADSIGQAACYRYFDFRTRDEFTLSERGRLVRSHRL